MAARHPTRGSPPKKPSCAPQNVQAAEKRSSKLPSTGPAGMCWVRGFAESCRMAFLGRQRCSAPWQGLSPVSCIDYLLFISYECTKPMLTPRSQSVFRGQKARLRQKAQFSRPSPARNFLPLHAGHSFPAAFSRKGPKTGESCHADKTAGIKSRPGSPISFYFCTEGIASFKALRYQLLQGKVGFQ